MSRNSVSCNRSKEIHFWYLNPSHFTYGHYSTYRI
jgi:hypothetical protein